MKHTILLLIVLIIIAGCGSNDQLFKESTYDFPVWRGVNADGIFTHETIQPETIPAVLTEVWKKSVGVGFSSMVTRGDVLYTMGNDKPNDTVYCINMKTGKTIWSYSYECAPGQYPGPNATPTLQGEMLITLSKTGDLFCFNAKDGKVIWQKQLVGEYGVEANEYGFAGSPLVVNNMILLNAGKYGLTINMQNGDIIWKSEAGVGGYATPVLYESNGTVNALLFGQEALYGINASDGTLLWSYPWETDYDANISDPIVAGTRVLISSGYGRGAACIDFKDNNPVLVWKNKLLRSHFSNLIYLDGYVYGVDGQADMRKGKYTCIEFETGKEIWSKYIEFGNIIATTKYLFCISEKGYIVVADLSPAEFNQLYQGQFKGIQFRGYPILNNGRLFLKDSAIGTLYCINLKLE